MVVLGRQGAIREESDHIVESHLLCDAILSHDLPSKFISPQKS